MKWCSRAQLTARPAAAAVSFKLVQTTTRNYAIDCLLLAALYWRNKQAANNWSISASLNLRKQSRLVGSKQIAALTPNHTGWFVIETREKIVKYR